MTLTKSAIAGPAGSSAGVWSASPEQLRGLAQSLAQYARPDARRSLLQLTVTSIPIVALWVAMELSVDNAYWLTLLLAIPAAAFQVRLFMIQHDCGHQSFFRSRRWNNLLGNVIGVLTLTPHGYWRRTHNMHHATCANLEKRGIGDIDVLTVSEYRALPRWRRVMYRIYRHPLALLGVGPIYIFVVKFRLPLDLLRQQPRALPGVLATNLAIATLFIVMGLWLGFVEVLMVQLPIVVLSSAAGVFLFYVQHQFENASWRHESEWDFHEASLHGSSFYDLPQPLRWLTANIGLHHIHHLAPRVPNYRLPECLREFRELATVNRVTLWQGLKCFRLSLWDEEAGRLIGFRAARGRKVSTR